MHPWKTSRIRFSATLAALAIICPPIQSTNVFFSPEGGVRDQIIKRINISKNTIDVAVYSFTSGDIAEAMANAAKRGVKIRVVRDASQSLNKNDENAYLEQSRIQVHITTGKGRGIMHDKFSIFDGKEACTGSYNWTANAEYYNWENWLCNDEKKVVKAFQKEFEALWKTLPKPIMHKNGHHENSSLKKPDNLEAT